MQLKPEIEEFVFNYINSLPELEDTFVVEGEKRGLNPTFKPITEDTYSQLSTGIYNTWGRRLNLTPRVLDENGVWTGEYKDWSHLQEIKVRMGYYEYLNCEWAFIDQRPNRVHKCVCRESYIFDKKVLTIQEVTHEYTYLKILVRDEDEELRLYIEDILEDKPKSVVPKREIREINDLEYQGLEFGSSQLKINMNAAKEQKDSQGLVITNGDHYDNYVYEVYDSLRNIYQHLNEEKARRGAEAQTIWLEDWINKKHLTNDMQVICEYMTEEVVEVFSKYLYRDKDFYDRRSCGGYLFNDVEFEVYDIDTLSMKKVKGKRMEKLSEDLDIPITVAWDIWKILNMRRMQEVIDRLYEEYPL